MKLIILGENYEEFPSFFSFPEIEFIKPLFRRIIQNTRNICSLTLPNIYPQTSVDWRK
jgi:hypothetical protein